MKNRKLFAIITLVAFMLTMMPMMAFAASASGSSISVDDASAKVTTYYTQAEEDADEDGEITAGDVKSTDYLEIVLDVDDAIAASDEVLVVFAERNGSLSDADYFLTEKAGDGVDPLTGDAGYIVLDNSDVDKAKEVKLYVASKSAGTVTFKAYVVKGAGVNKDTNVATLYNGDSEYIKTGLVGNGCTGKFTTTSSNIAATATVTAEGFVLNDDNADKNIWGGADANNGVDYFDVTLAFTKGGSKLVGEDVTISVDKDGATVNKTEVTTSATGKVDFKVSASKAGKYTVTVDCGTFSEDYVFNFGSSQITKVEFTSTVEGTIAVDAQEKVAMQLAAYDANGNLVPAKTSNTEVGAFKVEVISAPEDSSMEDDELTINYDPATSENLFVSFTPDAAGSYTIKVYNEDTGIADTTTINAAEFGVVDHATISYSSNTYSLGAQTTAPTVYVYDQNGVKKLATAKKFSYSGLGVAKFDANGQITFKNDSDYAGKEVVVSVVANNKYSATTTLTIGAEPAALQFTAANGEVGQEVTVNAQVVDINGNPAAISAPDYYEVSLESAIIVERPEGATVSVDADYFTNYESTFLKKGTGKVVISSNKEGTVKANVVIKLTPDNAMAEELELTTVYLTGVAVANFGEGAADVTGADDIVTFIIGSQTFIANDKAITSDVAPYIVDGRTFIPVRAFVEATGASVEYDAATQVVTIAGEGIDAQMTIGSNILTVNGETVVMDTAAQIKDGRTVLPIRYAGQAIGYDFECAYGADGAVTSVTMFK